MEKIGSESLVRHAFSEQRKSQLYWLQKTTRALEQLDLTETSPKADITIKLQAIFNQSWKTSVEESTKLRFYQKCKINLNDGICFEPYLSIKNIHDRKYMMQLRSSSHRLKIETGRYKPNNATVSDSERLCQRRCDFSTTVDVEPLCTLPFAEIPILEDEHHVLISCPMYHKLRLDLDPPLKSLILRNHEHYLLFSSEYMRKMGHYVKNIFNIRFPKN